MTATRKDEAPQEMTDLLLTLDRVVSRLAAIQQTPRMYGTTVRLYSTEIHTIQAIGKMPRANVTRLAKHMGVTKGAISQTIAKLVGKGLVHKERAPGDLREVCLELTELGRVAHRNHEAFDRQILSAFRAYCGSDMDEKTKLYLTVLQDFEAILQLHEEMS
jgi:DNA-binding MarR family transcriptional regulator